MPSVGTASIDLVVDKQQVGRNITGAVDDATPSVVSSFKKMAAAAAGAFVATKAVEFFKSAVSGASDLSESMSKVNVVFGSSAREIQSWSKNAAESMGQSRQQALEAVGTFGNLAISLGVPREKATDMSKSMVQLASDLASFNNTPVDEALNALRSGLSGEAEPLKRFGVALNDATLKAKALSMGIIANTNDALTPAAKAQATYALVMEQTKLAQGDFARTSDGLANKQKILGAQFEDMKTKIGGALIPAVLAITTLLVDRFEPVLIGVGIAAAVAAVSIVAGWVSAAAASIASTATQLANFAVTIAHWVASAGAATLNAAIIVAGWVSIAAGAAANTAASTAQMVIQGAKWVWLGITALASAAQIAAAWLISIWPIALIIAAVVGLAVIIVKNWDTIRDAIVGAATFVLDFLKANWPTILAVITGPIGLAVLAITRNWDTIKSGVAAVYDFVADKLGAMVSFITGLPGRIASAARGMFDGIKQAFFNVINWIISAWNGLEFKIPGFDPPGPGPKFNEFTLGVPNIDPVKFHKGGVFDSKKAAGEGLALLRDGERVLTPIQNQWWETMRSTAATAQNIAVDSARGAVREGPAVEILEAHFHDDIDLRMLFTEAQFASQMGQVGG